MNTKDIVELDEIEFYEKAIEAWSRIWANSFSEHRMKEAEKNIRVLEEHVKILKARLD